MIFNSKAPIYIQIYEYMKKEIVSGNIRSGEKLTSKRKLSEKLGVSVNSVTKAYYLLEEEGYIEGRERSGYFVEQIGNTYISVTKSAKKDIEREKTQEILYDFSVNNIAKDKFPFYTFSKIYKNILNEEKMNILYSSNPNGEYILKEAIAKYLFDRRGLETECENIVISSGMEYLFQLLFYIFDKETVFGVENPGYDVLPPLIVQNGFEYKSIDVEKCISEFSEVEKSAVDIMCITPAHQFPTGKIYPFNTRLDILKWAEEKEGRYIIEDDYDSEFRYVGKPMETLKSIDRKDKVIYIGNFSKAIAPSVRISYMILPEKLRKKLEEVAPFYVCPVPVLDQIVVSEFINGGYFERHLNKMRRIYKKRREISIEELGKYKQISEISGSDAGLHINVSFITEKSDKLLYNVFKDNGILIKPMSDFYNRSPKSHSVFLLGFGGLDEEMLEVGIKKIVALL